MNFKNKIYMPIICMLLVITLVCQINFVYADENIDKTEEKEDILKDEIIKVTDEKFEVIEKLLQSISDKLNNIDKRILLAQSMPEYENYPAVRLNIDTPYFGIISLVDSKLKITNLVSTIDIASGYSIKDVVNKKVIKVESFDIADIVVITRDVKIDKDMTDSDANTVILKLIKYYEQTENVSKFLEKQLTSIFKSYLYTEKSDASVELSSNVSECVSNLIEIRKDISTLLILTDDLSNDIKEYLELFDLVSKYKEYSNDLLLETEEINKKNDEIIKLKEQLKNLYDKLESKKEESLKNIDIKNILNNKIISLNSEIEYVENFIDKSKETIVKNDILSESKNEVSKVEDNLSNDKETNKSILNDKDNFKEIYKVNSEHLLEYMRKDLETLKNMIKEEEDFEIKNNKDKVKGLVQIYQDEINEKERLEKQEKENKLKKINDICLGFYAKEVSFITNNIQVNVKAIKGSNNIDTSEFDAIKYIYMDIQMQLNDILDNYIRYDILSNMNSISKFKVILEKVIDVENKLLIK